MIKIEQTLTIHRPVDEVFAYLCDVAHAPLYISGQSEAHTTSSGPMGVGTTFATTGKFPRRGGTNEITEFEPNRRFAWKATSGSPATTTWQLEPSGPSTRVTFTRVSDHQGLMKLAEPVFEGMAKGRVEHDLGALKELLAVTRTPATSAAKTW
jgi:uncharacterized protein YndB with AHSA1/START domain